MEQFVAFHQEVLVVLSEMVKVDLTSVRKVFTIVIKWWLRNVNWFLILELLQSLVFGIIEGLESGEKVAFNLIVIFDHDNSFAFEVFDLVLDDLVVLQILNANVVFENGVNSSHIGEADGMMLFDVLSDEIWLFVLMILDEEANVSNCDGWSSSNSRGAMKVNSVVMNIDHIVKLDYSLQDVIIKLSFCLRVINWHMNDSVDSLASIELFDGRGINTSMSDFISSLKVQNCGSSLIGNLVNIDLIQRIWTKNDFSVRNL